MCDPEAEAEIRIRIPGGSFGWPLRLAGVWSEDYYDWREAIIIASDITMRRFLVNRALHERMLDYNESFYYIIGLDRNDRRSIRYSNTCRSNEIDFAKLRLIEDESGAAYEITKRRFFATAVRPERFSLH